MNVLFEHCEFKGNNACWHGGAIAIQTFGNVYIIDCLFKDNKADVSETSGQILWNHFNLKEKGRGGAIYINPNYDTGKP